MTNTMSERITVHGRHREGMKAAQICMHLQLCWIGTQAAVCDGLSVVYEFSSALLHSLCCNTSLRAWAVQYWHRMTCPGEHNKHRIIDVIRSSTD
jgi:hypothetical protein